MAKEDKESQAFPPPRPLPESEKLSDKVQVVVSVKRAVGWGGRPIRPLVDGGKVTPVEALLPKRVALRYGPETLEILRDATPEDLKNPALGGKTV